MKFPSLFLALGLIVYSCSEPEPGLLQLKEGDSIVMIGNNLCSRMSHFGYFETAIYGAYPTAQLTVRSTCDPANTTGFRPHSSRKSPWAFPGAEDYNPGLLENSNSQGHFPTEDEWLDTLNADVILAFFGLNESFAGPEGLNNFALELDSFLRYTQVQRYNEEAAPRLVLLSPLAFEDLSVDHDLPDGEAENENLELYVRAMQDIAFDNGVTFIDLFAPSTAWMNDGQITTDGISLNDFGYQKLAGYLSERLFNHTPAENETLRAAVKEKNTMWLLDFKMPNGVHAYGRRFEPYGPDNYPYEITKVRQMTANRDAAIWANLAGEPYDLAAADRATKKLPEVVTNYKLQPLDEVEYNYGDEALATFTTAPGYKIELFASEREFPLLANPCQMNWDNRGRLWVAVMPSYPHYKPGDELPNDKLIILEDTDADGKADALKVWADSLHLPVGFEIADDGGVYVSQGTDLMYLKDTDGDDRADHREVIMSGFDDHDTHHNISAYEADPGGGIYMGEGVFLHTNVETPYGPVRATNGGFYRLDPRRKQLERTAQIPIPNPWGIIFDAWGQPIFAHTSGPDVRWMLPSTIRSVYGASNPMDRSIIEEKHRVRPTSGLEIVSSRHFPPGVQGDLLINNTIGFLGTKQHRLLDAGTGFDSRWRQDLVTSTDGNFRPVDMEFAPDGSLYLVDWHNVLVGHMQHNARDPLRDHVHGRIYRITYPSRPLVEPARIAGAPVATLLENLKLPEYRTRYRTRRELRGRPKAEVMLALKNWVNLLDPEVANYGELLREALFVSWGANLIDREILNAALASSDFRLRAAATRVIRYLGHQLGDRADLLTTLATDAHPRVRMEAMVAASWLPAEIGEPILATARLQPTDELATNVLNSAEAHLKGYKYEPPLANITEDPDSPIARAYALGKSVYLREGFCGTCHQENGKGLNASGYPPLAGSRWVTGSPERLIKLTMHGIYGPIEVKGKNYDGQVPMTAFKGMMTNEEMAAVLTYVRNAFGNEASMIDADQIATVNTSTAGRDGFYTAEELLEEHPDEVSGKK